VDVKAPGTISAESTRVMGRFLRDVMKRNMSSRNFRLFSPDENNSNRWQDVLEVTNRCYVAEILPEDDHLSPDGRVMEVLSEHQCQGWLEGYLLTGRHGFFSCYEAFIHIIDSMFNQHAKWLKVCNHIQWRRPIASLNYLLSSHVWRQDHNGFSHQDPGFIDHVVNKKSEVIRVYLPPDANTLLWVTDQCMRSRNCVNVVVAGKQPAPQWLTMDQAIKHCSAGIGIWDWASNDGGAEPDLVIASAGDILTQEALAAVAILREHFPDVKIRFVNVVDLYRLQPDTEHPHGLSARDFDSLFTRDKPVIFNFHGYPWLIHKFTYRRTNHANIHVRGYKEKGNINTPLELAIQNQVDRFNLAIDAIDRVPKLQSAGAHLKEWLKGQISQRFSNRVGWNNQRLETDCFPSVIIHTSAKEIHRPDITGPLSLFLNIRGTSHCKVDDRTVQINDGFFFVSNRLQSYTLEIRTKSPTETFNIHFGELFSEQVLAGLVTPADSLLNDGQRKELPSLSFYNKLYPRDAVFNELCGKLCEMSKEDRPDKLLFEERLTDLLVWLLKQHRHILQAVDRMPAAKPSTRHELYKRLSYSLDYIHSGFTGAIGLEELSATAFLSKYHFLRLFKLTFGLSPHQYIQKLRLEKASQLLKHSPLPVGDIADALGFENSQSFSRLFFQRTGMYPSRYRAG